MSIWSTVKYDVLLLHAVKTETQQQCVLEL